MGRAGTHVRCVDTGEIFESLEDAAKAVGLKPKTIMRACQRKTRSAGFLWEHADPSMVTPEKEVKTFDGYDIKDLDEHGVNNLIVAMVEHAVNDWKNAKRVLSRHPDNDNAWRSLFDVERFFLSDYFSTLTGLDGKSTLKRLEKLYDGRHPDAAHRRP